VPRQLRNQPPRNLLRIEGAVSARSRNLLFTTWTGLPLEPGRPVQVAFLPQLTAHRGKLLSGADRGTPVYAASFIRRRRIVLETSLLADPASLRFIFVHELFHFVWVRIGNRVRDEYSALLLGEIARHARGELGESSAVKKAELRQHVKLSPNSPLWRDYICESFCDSAARIFTGAAVHTGPSLAKRWTAMRRDWFSSKRDRERRWAV
jgi:hypothetical protein